MDAVVAYAGAGVLPARVWRLAVQEYRRNGGRMLTPGKLRWIRRQARRGAGSGTGGYLAAVPAWDGVSRVSGWLDQRRAGAAYTPHQRQQARVWLDGLQVEEPSVSR